MKLLLMLALSCFLLDNAPPPGHEGHLYNDAGQECASYRVSVPAGSSIFIDVGPGGQSWTVLHDPDHPNDTNFYYGGTGYMDATAFVSFYCEASNQDGCYRWRWTVFGSQSPTGHGPPFAQTSTGYCN